MLSKNKTYRSALRAAFVVAGITTLSACSFKENDIEACIKQGTDINNSVVIHDNGVSMEYWYESQPHDRYVKYYIFTDQPGLDTYIEKGYRLRERQGKSRTTLHFEDTHWYDAGTDEPKRSIIQAMKKCVKQALPERAPHF